MARGRRALFLALSVHRSPWRGLWLSRPSPLSSTISGHTGAAPPGLALSAAGQRRPGTGPGIRKGPLRGEGTAGGGGSLPDARALGRGPGSGRARRLSANPGFRAQQPQHRSGHLKRGHLPAVSPHPVPRCHRSRLCDQPASPGRGAASAGGGAGGGRGAMVLLLGDAPPPRPPRVPLPSARARLSSSFPMRHLPLASKGHLSCFCGDTIFYFCAVKQ